MTHRLHIPEMSCNGCVRRITKAVEKLDANATVEAALDTREVQVSTEAPLPALREALAQAGYPATLVD